VQAAVDADHLAGDVCGPVGAEEAHQPGDVLRLAEAAGGIRRRSLSACSGCSARHSSSRGVFVGPGLTALQVTPLRRQLLSERLAERDQARLGG
jgi:hypothetical protein